MTRLRSILLVLSTVSCAADDGDTTTVADTGAATDVTTNPGTDDSATDPTDASATDPTNPSATDDPTNPSTDDSATDPTDASVTDDPTDATTGAADTGSDDTTTGGPTTGPGVLPGESGLEAFCRRYVECGGTYYDSEQSCIDASYDYWGSCPSRAAALDEFGACMSEMECREWSPDAYNPASTPCAEQWQGVGASDPC